MKAGSVRKNGHTRIIKSSQVCSVLAAARLRRSESYSKHGGGLAGAS